MTGEELYELYVQAHSERGCGVDSWESIDDTDRETWDRIAELATDQLA